MVPDRRRIKTFASETAFEEWLAVHHGTEPEVWINIYKKASGLASVTAANALDVALCWGWIDAIRKGFDERSFLQRYTPRRRRSRWSQINREHAARLVAAGRRTPHGQHEIDAATADGRWKAAYAPIRAATPATVPADLRRAIDANPRAKRTFRTLNRQNLFALAFRTNAMRTPAGRARKIAGLVAMLARGETIVPSRAVAGRARKKRRAGEAGREEADMWHRRAMALVLGVVPALVSGQTTPYAGQQAREIKALSSEEIESYLSGSGMGLAKAAEL